MEDKTYQQIEKSLNSPRTNITGQLQQNIDQSPTISSNAPRTTVRTTQSNNNGGKK